MKIYRRSFWKASTTQARIIPMVTVILILSPVFPSIKDFLYCYMWLSWIIPLFITQYFYVILTDNEVIIKNSILPFWKRIYNYSDIVKFRIIHHGSRADGYMQVKSKSQKGWWKYTTDLVNEKEYSQLIRDLEAKGVVVETKGIDHILKQYP